MILNCIQPQKNKTKAQLWEFLDETLQDHLVHTVQRNLHCAVEHFLFYYSNIAF